MKVVVVGGSVAGLSVARYLLSSGLDCEVSIVERKKAFGDNIVCAGGLASYMVKKLQLQVSDEFVARKVHRVRFYSPSLDYADLELHKEYGLILWRDRWEKWLGQQVEELGAKVHLNVKDSTKMLKDADVVVGADGLTGVSRRLAGKPFPSSDDVHIAIQAVGKTKFADEEAISLFFGSHVAPRGYCLAPGATIVTKEGLKQIQEICIGDEVMTLHGWDYVTAVNVRKYEGKVIGITPFMFNEEVRLTPDHLVYVWNHKEGFTWKPASNLIAGRRGKRGDYLVICKPSCEKIDEIKLENIIKGVRKNGYIYPSGRNQYGAVFAYKKRYGLPEHLKLTPELMELFGYYVSEGCIKGGSLVISNTDDKIVSRILDISGRLGFKTHIWYGHREGRDKDVVNVQFGRLLGQLFRNFFSTGSRNKTIPYFFFGMQKDLKVAFLKGLFLGDGAKEKNKTSDILSYTTTSKRLLYSLWLFLISMDIVASSGQIKKKNAYRLRIYGHQANLINPFQKLSLAARKSNRGFKILGPYILLGIRKLNSYHYSGPVYDVQSNGSFSAPFIVHNCWLFPLQGGEFRIGLGVPLTYASNLKRYFDTFLSSVEAELSEKPKVKMIPTAHPEKNLVSNIIPRGIMGKPIALVGDSGCMTDAATGGGIAPAILGAKCLSEALNRGSLKLYDKLWKGELYRRNKQRYGLKQVLCELSDGEWQMIIQRFKDFKPVSESIGWALLHLILDIAIDNPSFIVRHKVLRRLLV